MSNSTTKLTLGQRAADAVAGGIGSWRFVIIQTVFFIAYMGWNEVPGLTHWDVYPFIFLNLILAFEAGYTGPILMISSNRQEAIQKQTLATILDVAEATRLIVSDHRETLSMIQTHEAEEVLALKEILQQVTGEGELG